MTYFHHFFQTIPGVLGGGSHHDSLFVSCCFFFLLFLSCPFFLSVPASLSDQLGQVRSLGGSGGGGGGLSLLLYLFVCLPVVQRMYLFTCLFILIALFVRSLINLDK